MKKSTGFLIISAILTVAICGVMNFVLFPIIEETTQGLKAFDMNSFGYSFEAAKQFSSLISEKGLETYLNVQLPLDFFYPVCYTTFFCLAISKLKMKNGFFVVPALLFAFDYCENIFSEIMLRTDFSKNIASIASTSTICKSILMYITFIMLAIAFVKNLISVKKAK